MNTIHEQLDLQDNETRNRLESLMVAARGISHDFNNIMTILFGKISVAKTIAADKMIVSLLADMEKSCTRACELNNQFMEFSKGDSSTRTIVYLPFVVKSTADLVLRDASITPVYEFMNNIPPVVANEVQIRQVILNLLINAMQAMPRGGTITIGMECVEMHGDNESRNEGTYIRISVRDEGMGIPARYLSKVFDCNFSTKPTGSGLGLTICNMIVNNHGGSITVFSEEGKGTLFNVYLPVLL